MSNDWNDWLPTIETEFVFNKDNFLRQPNISRTLHPGSTIQTYQKYYDELKEEKYLYKDPDTGNPILSQWGISLVAFQSSYYLKTLLENNLLDDIQSIYDIGGGYGSMCRVLRNYGWKGSYNLIDFDVVHKIQRYFLEKNNIYNFRQLKLDDLKTERWRPRGKTLLIATHSINEMPMSDRSKINYSDFTNLLIVHNSKWNNINNSEYFKSLKLPHKTKHYRSNLSMSHYFFIGTQQAW